MTRKAKILVLTSTFPRFAGDPEPAFVYQLCAGLQKYFEVHVLAPMTQGAQREEVLDGVRVFRYRYAPAALEVLAYEGGILEKLKRAPWLYLVVPWFLLGQGLAIWRLHRRHRYDLIHAHWIIPQGLVAAVFGVCAAPRTPLLLTSHGADLFALNGRFTSRLKRWILARAAHVTVVSRAMKERVCALGIPAVRVTVRSMGVDLRGRFDPESHRGAAQSHGSSIQDGLLSNTPVDPCSAAEAKPLASQRMPSSPHHDSWSVPEPLQDTATLDAEGPRQGLIFVGRLVEKKGVDVLLQAFAALLPRHPDLRLTIAGEGPLGSHLRALAESLGVAGAVTFLGAVVNTDVPPLLRRARIAVVPSVVAASGDQEGLGLVIIEAMGCGCLVVASDLPAIRDAVIEGETGFLVEAGHPEKLAERLHSLLASDEDHVTIRLAARTRVLREFDWDGVIRDHARIMAALLHPAPVVPGRGGD